MAIRVALHHYTEYAYDRPVSLSPHVFRLRPAVHSRPCRDAILSLRRRGRHVQIGLMVGADAAPPIPMGRVISHELEILGSHGMAAHRFGAVFGMMTRGRLQPDKLIQRRIPLAASIDTLVEMDRFASPGVTIISAEE